MNNPWIQHVLRYQKVHHVPTFSEALSKAKKSYKNQTGNARTRSMYQREKNAQSTRTVRRRKPRRPKLPQISSRLSRRVFVLVYPNDNSEEIFRVKAAVLGSLPDHKNIVESRIQKGKKFKKTLGNIRTRPKRQKKKSFKQDSRVFQSMNDNNKTLPMCKRQVNSEYIYYAMNSCEYILLMYSGTPPTKRHPGVRGRIRGFALVKTTQNSVYLDVLCGEGQSKKLIEAVENLGRELGKPYAELYALEPVIGYYFKQQYIPVQDDGKYVISQDVMREIDLPDNFTADMIKNIKFDKARVAKMIKERINKQVHTKNGNVMHPKDCVKKNGTYNFDICGTNGYRMIKRL